MSHCPFFSVQQDVDFGVSVCADVEQLECEGEIYLIDLKL